MSSVWKSEKLDSTLDTPQETPPAAEVSVADDVPDSGGPVRLPVATFDPTSNPADSPTDRIEELLDDIRQTLLAARDAMARGARAEADAWATTQVAAKVDRMRAETEKSTDSAEAIEAKVAARVEQALNDAASRHATEVAQIKAQAEELLAQRFYSNLQTPDASTAPEAPDSGLDERVEVARREERQAVLSEVDRLRRTMSQLDDARSLDEVLDTLGHALDSEVTRLALARVSDAGVELWQAMGFTPPLETVAIPLDPNRPGVVARVLETGILSFAHPTEEHGSDVEFAEVPTEAVGLAVPIVGGGQVVAVVYADDGGQLVRFAEHVAGGGWGPGEPREPLPRCVERIGSSHGSAANARRRCLRPSVCAWLSGRYPGLSFHHHSLGDAE